MVKDSTARGSFEGPNLTALIKRMAWTPDEKTKILSCNTEKEAAAVVKRKLMEQKRSTAGPSEEEAPAPAPAAGAPGSAGRRHHEDALATPALAAEAPRSAGRRHQEDEEDACDEDLEARVYMGGGGENGGGMPKFNREIRQDFVAAKAEAREALVAFRKSL